jgi:multidrug efflux system membrane fusion protein
VPVGNSRALPVIPQTAVRPSEKGFLAYVVENGLAAERILTPGMRTADGQIEILSGLQSGELLVVRGAEALVNGAAVRLTGSLADGNQKKTVPPVK